MDINIYKTEDGLFVVCVDGRVIQPPTTEKEARRLAEFLRRTSNGEDARPLLMLSAEITD